MYNPKRRIQHLLLYDEGNACNDVIDELLMEEECVGIKTLDYLTNGLVIAHQYYDGERWLLLQSKQIKSKQQYPYIPTECQTEEVAEDEDDEKDKDNEKNNLKDTNDTD